MTLVVAYDAPINATSVVAAEATPICPVPTSATVIFEVATGRAAAGVEGVLLNNATLERVEGASCSAAAVGPARNNWTVTCVGAPFGGSYVLSAAATSAIGGYRPARCPPL